MKFLPKIPFLKKIPDKLLKPPHFKKPDVNDLKEDMEKLGEQIAEGFKDKVIENIEDNTYGFILSPKTIKMKGSDTPLIDTGQMLGAIYRDGTTVSVNDEVHGKSGLTNKQIAIINEYGTKDRHVPARPVWRNTFSDYREEAEKQVEEFFVDKEHKFKEPKEPIKKAKRSKRKKK